MRDMSLRRKMNNMSDRISCSVSCPYCEEVVEDFWYAPGCGIDSGICLRCKKKYFVVNCSSVKTEEVTSKSLLEAFLDSLNIWDPNEQQQAEILKDYEEQIQEAKEFNLRNE
jgi:hypothetical protein